MAAVKRGLQHELQYNKFQRGLLPTVPLPGETHNEMVDEIVRLLATIDHMEEMQPMSPASDRAAATLTVQSSRRSWAEEFDFSSLEELD